MQSNNSFSTLNNVMYSPVTNTPNYEKITTTNKIIPYSFQGTNQSADLIVSGDAQIEGDIKWKGRSLEEMLKKIEDRLAILVPDPEKLEQFEALKKAYDQYKLLEALFQEGSNDKSRK